VKVEMVNGFDGSSVIALGQVAYLKHECAPLLKVPPCSKLSILYQLFVVFAIDVNYRSVSRFSRYL